jgi:hypothetical protein
MNSLQFNLILMILFFSSCTNKSQTDVVYFYGKNILNVDSFEFNDISTKKSSNDSIKNDSLSRINYLEIMDSVVTKMIVNDSVSISDIEQIIPRTESEYLIYYGYRDQKISEKKILAYFKIDNSLKFYANENKGNILELYLRMLEFVDGEYAEILDDDVPFVVKANKKRFCELYPHLSQRCQFILEDLHKKYCGCKK